MDKSLKFTVITVSFNNGKTLEQTIQSVLGQSYSFIEYLVIDGGSTDGSKAILEKYRDRIQWISEPDKGIYDAMNKGIKLATGDFVGFLNADDFYANPKVLENMAAVLQTNPTALAAYGDLAYVKEDQVDSIVRYWKSGPYDRDAFKTGWMPPHPTFYLKRECFAEFGGFRNEDLASAADYELMLRMLYKHKLHCVYNPELMVRMRTGGVSNRNLKNRVRGNKEDQKAWDLNHLRPGRFTFLLKPLRKIPQFWQRPNS